MTVTVTPMPKEYAEAMPIFDPATQVLVDGLVEQKEETLNKEEK